MCNFFSLVATKDNIYYDITLDSHSDIIEKFKIKEKTGENFNVCKIEITPPKGDVFLNPEDWIFRIDEEIIPDWIDKIKTESKVRVILKEIKKQYILENKKIKILQDGRYWIKDGKIEVIKGNCIIEYVGGSATINYVGGSATINYVGGSATINYVRDSATIKDVGGYATINYVGDSATIKDVGGYATIKDVNDFAYYKKGNGICTKNKDLKIIIKG
jgi:hypothetical protein